MVDGHTVLGQNSTVLTLFTLNCVSSAALAVDRATNHYRIAVGDRCVDLAGKLSLVFWSLIQDTLLDRVMFSESFRLSRLHNFTIKISAWVIFLKFVQVTVLMIFTLTNNDIRTVIFVENKVINERV